MNKLTNSISLLFEYLAANWKTMDQDKLNQALDNLNFPEYYIDSIQKIEARGDKLVIYTLEPDLEGYLRENGELVIIMHILPAFKYVSNALH